MAAIDDPTALGHARPSFADQHDIDEFVATLEQFEREEIGPEDVPIGEGRHPVDGRPAAYVCRNRTWDAPVTNVKALLEHCAA